MSVTFDSTTLLDQLQQKVKELASTVEEQLHHLPAPVLLLPPAQDKWSAIQCLEHLNTYSRFYLPQIASAIERGYAKQLPATTSFKSGWLGNWFTNTMQPKPDGTLPMKMQSPKNARPVTDLDAAKVMAEFLDGQQQLLTLLQRAEGVNLQRLKVPTSLGKWLRLSLGDTFRFFIAHEERHVLQALHAVGA
ncbi:DinB family protein [uncultured Chitinophaga sp.]|jgi:hypothetical protein|uniref:DinB family protein n=1 Tax=uncultured Chitinophaga sp. TaxID=339340 RepID=UPI0026346255|nr:DinB family protein [uncultured Chitinophaga sp.]